MYTYMWRVHYVLYSHRYIAVIAVHNIAAGLCRYCVSTYWYCSHNVRVCTIHTYLPCDFGSLKNIWKYQLPIKVYGNFKERKGRGWICKKVSQNSELAVQKTWQKHFYQKFIAISTFVAVKFSSPWEKNPA